MNDFTTLLIATGRMEDRLREAERDRLAAHAARPTPGRASLWARLRWLRRLGSVGSGTGRRPVATPSTVVRPC